MGLRKPAVRSVLKAAKRKHQEGKTQQAEALAQKAGQAAGRHDKAGAISETAKTVRLPGQVVAKAEAACLNETLPVRPGRRRLVTI